MYNTKDMSVEIGNVLHLFRGDDCEFLFYYVFYDVFLVSHNIKNTDPCPFQWCTASAQLHFCFTRTFVYQRHGPSQQFVGQTIPCTKITFCRFLKILAIKAKRAWQWDIWQAREPCWVKQFAVWSVIRECLLHVWNM